MAKTALIIGGTGLLGRGIAAEMLAANWKVSIISRGKVQPPREISSVEMLTADRSDRERMARVLGDRHFDVIVDCAAYSARDGADALGFSGKTSHYFFISTDFVYARDPVARYPLSENAKKNEGLDYATGKLCIEKTLLDAHAMSGFPVSVLRPPHILGAGRAAGCDPVAGGRDSGLIERMRRGEELPVLNEGEFLIQPVWSREIGSAIILLAGQSGTWGEIYNIAGPECVTTREYYEMAARIADTSVRFRNVSSEAFCAENPDKAHISRHRIYDLGKIAVAGYKPAMSLEDAMRETVTWMHG